MGSPLGPLRVGGSSPCPPTLNSAVASCSATPPAWPRRCLQRPPWRPTPAWPGLIQAENQRPGTLDWMATNVRVDPKARYRSPWIEGFASRTSVRPGGSIDLCVSTNPASTFVIDLYRMGFYQGKGARHMLRIGPFDGQVQPEPPTGEMRLKECRWEPCTSLEIPDDWPSGVYLGKLTAGRDGLQSYLIFVVRDDRRADFLFQVSDNTWNAYNRWPSQFSLYDDGKKEWYWGPGVKVGFDRPYGKYCQILDAPLSVGTGEFLLWEFPWLSGWKKPATMSRTFRTSTLTPIPRA